jgi:excisionase family DNA binding protein
MPRTTSKGKSIPATPPAAVNGPAGSDVLTLTEAAAYLRLSEEQVAELAESQDLPGRRIGTEWRFLRSAIQNWLSQPAAPSSKAALRELAGAWKDDPHLETIVKEAYKRRGRPISEAGE